MSTRTIEQIAIIGAGIMGSDLALTCAAAGHRVTLVDISGEALSRFLGGFEQQLRGYQLLNPGLRKVKADELMSRIRTRTGFDELSEVSWIIENVAEAWDTKAAVYRQLAKTWRAGCYVGVNTSCISITRLARLLPEPERVIGMHFMNPVPLKPCVEVMASRLTSKETIEAARALLGDLHKKPILVQDSPGFVSNRLSHLFMNEAAFLVQDRVADPVAIDSLFREGFGHAMGPLETADLIGLDTVLASLHGLYEEYQDPKFRRCPLLQKMVEAGEYGRKSGKGFYEYR